MEPQLLIPSPAADFNFDSTSTSPYATTAPSSPKIIFPKFFHAADDFQSTDPFEISEVIHEHKNEDLEEADTDFAFDFSGQLEPPSISDADQLFDGGKIKPLEQPPPPPPPAPSSSTLVLVSNGTINLELFSEALRRTPKEQTLNKRSLSPLRLSDVKSNDQIKVATSQSQSSPFGFTWYNKWNLKNLLLFRSTSEGSAATRDEQLKKYAMITKGDVDVKNSSFRSSDGGGSSRRMKRKVSAHEMHYTANRAVAEEMRRKTSLPYKSGLLGCLGFSHDLREVSRRR